MDAQAPAARAKRESRHERGLCLGSRRPRGQCGASCFSRAAAIATRSCACAILWQTRALDDRMSKPRTCNVENCAPPILSHPAPGPRVLLEPSRDGPRECRSRSILVAGGRIEHRS